MSSKLLKKPRDRFYSNPGSQYADKHAIRIDDNGHKTLAKTGEKTNIYAKICSHEQECDIVELLRRCDAEGYQVLNRAAVQEGDVTVVPHSFMEAQILLQEQENKFNQLPLDVRKSFGFSFTQYIAEAGKDINSWATKMGIVKAASATHQAEAPASEEKGGEE